MSNKRSSNGEDDRDILDIGKDIEELVFEDPFGDEFEEEEVVDNNDDNDEHDMNAITEEDPEAIQKQVWRPGVDELQDGETLEYDPSAYVTYHSLKTEWPCLSFDIIKDNLGDGRHRFPLSLMMVCGSQADRADRNKITIIKMSDIHKTQVDPDSEDDSEEDEELDEDPTLEHININHHGGINRIRCMPQSSGIVATMADTAQCHIYDLTTCARSMMVKGPRAMPPTKASYSFRGHRDEGYAVDWSPVVQGQLATGDCSGKIHIWTCGDMTSGTWQVDKNAYVGHQGSVEDIQWSPTEATVFCSGSCDKKLMIWDTRGRNGPQISLEAHSEDVNVISWNRTVSNLLASGSDDGSFKVWDLRSIRGGQPLANFRYHKQPITSIEWAPHDESVLCVSSADNQVTVWDLSVEADDSSIIANQEISPEIFPAQLLFIHQGQTNVKEVHFHPQIPGLILSTAEDSMNIFKPAINVV